MAENAFSRRAVLAAGALALAGCRGGSKKPAQQAAGQGLNLFVVTPSVPNGKPGRLVFVLKSDDQDPITPKEATFRFGPAPDNMTSPVAEAEIHTDAAPASTYLTLTVQLSPLGQLWTEITADGRTATAPITVVGAVPGIGEGEALPSVVTPSPGDDAGVELVCTRQPACPLHDLSLDKALALKQPLAVLVASPGFCQTDVCGPMLDVVLKAMPSAGDRVSFLHLDVYAERPKQQIVGTPLAPAVKAFGLQAEPTLYLVGADGVVRKRLDGVFGTGEVTRALGALS